MRHTNLFLRLIFGLLFFGAMQSYSQETNFRSSISIKQQNKTLSFANSFDSIFLNRDNFAIEFDLRKYNDKKKKWYATQIAAVTCDSCVALVTAGQLLEKVPFFSGGTGLAAEEFGYTNLFIDNEAHHYITYTNEKDRRAELVSVNGEMVRVKWTIPLAYYENQDFDFIKLPLDKFYLIIFNDGNLNKIIEEGEFCTVLIRLN